jgi:phosphate-selective porin OprO/OprP
MAGFSIELPPFTGALAADDPAALAAIGEVRPEEIEQLYERVLDLDPDRQNRQLIERVREATLDTEIGVDTTSEEWVTVKDNTYITWGGRIHADYVNWLSDTEFGGQPNYVEFRRVRLFAAGEGYGVYDYQLDIGFAPEFDLQGAVEDELLQEAGIELKDAYVGIRDIPLLGYLRIGHMRTPFSLEQLTSSNYLTFLERSLAHRLAPGRELGVTASARTPGENLTWAYGAYFDELPEEEPNIEDDNQGIRVVGRLTWTPWYDVPANGRYMLHTGLSYAYTRPRARDNPDLPGTLIRAVRFNARPEIHRGDQLIDTFDIDTQQYQVLNPEFALVRGPLSLQSELSWARIDEIAGRTTDIYGAYAYASWFLTGEHRAYDREGGRFSRVIPHENFWAVRTPRGVRRGFGAWELGARWSYLEFPDYGAQQLQDLTVGLNWYWNPNTRVMFNWIHPWARNSPLTTLVHAEGDVLSMRMQVDF